MNITDTQIRSAINNEHNWRDAAQRLVGLLCSDDCPFSSGEIARHLRVQSNFKFSVYNLGEFIRDMFYSGEIVFAGSGNACLVARITEGKFRTYAGQAVFVYAPDLESGDAHDFEVDIPEGAPKALSSGGVPNALPLGSDDVTPLTAPQGLSLKATVHADGRMQISRSAFEAFVHETGYPLRGGDPVFVSVTNDKVVVSLKDDDNFTSHDISVDRGRVRLFANTGTPFPAGESFTIEIKDDQMVIDLSSPLGS